MTRSFFQSFALPILLLVAFLLPLLVFGYVKAIESNYNNPAEWLPRHFEETQKFEQFLTRFEGESEMLVVSWDGCTIDDQRLSSLQARLEAVRVESADRPRPRMFTRIWTGYGVLREMTAELSITRAQALQRMSGWLVGPDGATSCAVLVVSPPAQRDREAVIAEVEGVAADLGLEADRLYMGGPTMDSVAIDRESERSLYMLKTVSVLINLFLCWKFLKSVRLMLIVMVTAFICEAAAISMVYISGRHMDSILMMMPALVNTLAVSGCVHYLNYYSSEIEESGLAGAAGRALARSWKPSLLASGTTAIGLVSLAVADVIPAKRFGIFSAIGVCLSMLILFTVVPAALELWPLRNRRPGQRPHDEPDAAGHSLHMRLAIFAIGSHRAILAICIILVPLLGWGALQIRTSVRLQDMFSERARVMQDYRWLETHIGPLVPVEVVLTFDNKSTLDILERLELAESVRESLEAMDYVGGTISAGTFLPPVPHEGAVRRHTAALRLERSRDEIRKMNYLAEAPDGEIWRVSARVEALRDIDYGAFLEEMQARIAPMIEQANRESASPVAVVFTGGVPLVSTVQRRLFDDLLSSFGTAFLTIAVLVMIVLRSIPAGLVTMLPNVFPPLLIFGIMGWSGIVVDLGSMMTISTALGISIDNELHFFTWFRRFLGQGMSRKDALLATYEHCGHAMEHTAIICGLGMGVFAFSAFVPVARFGWLMFLLIFAAMACDMLMLPSLLAGPLGALFGRPTKKSADSSMLESVAEVRS